MLPMFGENAIVRINLLGSKTEVPLVQFKLQLKEDCVKSCKIGVSNMLCRVTNQRHKKQNSEELENAIESLGASINASTDGESILLSGTTLAKKLPVTMKLVQEILLEPRWDKKI
jgi:zinc protease